MSESDEGLSAAPKMTSGGNYGDGERGSKTENCGEEKELADSFLANHER